MIFMNGQKHSLKRQIRLNHNYIIIQQHTNKMMIHKIHQIIVLKNKVI